MDRVNPFPHAQFFQTPSLAPNAPQPLLPPPSFPIRPFTFPRSLSPSPLPTPQVGYDPVYGARPVKRALQRELQTLLAQALLRNEFQEDDTVVVEACR